MNRKSEKFRNVFGNVIRVRTATGTWQIAYNGANRPVRFENAETQTVVDCGYDSLGRRYFKKVTVAGVVTQHQRYIYRGYLQIAAVDMTRRAQPMLWLVFWDPSQPTATRPLAIQKDGTWFTYGYDITKNVCELFGPAGYIRTAYDYAPFGAVSESDNGVAQPFQWSSEFYDSELDLVYYNYRHYSPSLGRFLSRDPIEEQGGRNLYAFVKNSPVFIEDGIGLVEIGPFECNIQVIGKCQLKVGIEYSAPGIVLYDSANNECGKLTVTEGAMTIDLPLVSIHVSCSVGIDISKEKECRRTCIKKCGKGAGILKSKCRTRCMQRCLRR